MCYLRESSSFQKWKNKQKVKPEEQEESKKDSLITLCSTLCENIRIRLACPAYNALFTCPYSFIHKFYKKKIQHKKVHLVESCMKGDK